MEISSVLMTLAVVLGWLAAAFVFAVAVRRWSDYIARQEHERDD